MAKVETVIEDYELDLTVLVVGCVHHEFNSEAILNGCARMKFRPEQENEVDANAISVRCNGEICGYIAKEHLGDAHKFREALKLMEPYIHEHDSGFEIGEIVKESDGRIQKFAIRMFAFARVPTETADALDRIQ